MQQGVDAGVIRIRVEDEVLSGDTVTVDGQCLVNFGSCAYLGLNVDPRLKQGAIAAIERFGPVFSSSAAYTSVDIYSALEARLARMFGTGHIVLPTTTTLGHLAALPVLVSPDDVVLVDTQSHASVHLATDVLRGRGISVTELPHNDMAALERALEEASNDRQCGIWYLADSIYSMYGDVAPVREIAALLDLYSSLHVYLDDAHGFGWRGLHGRGYVLDKIPLHERMVIVVSLAKSFGTGGAALLFADGDTAQRVWLAGGTLTFSGPIHPAELGAAVAAADIHLSDEHVERQARLISQIELVSGLLAGHRLPAMAFDPTPIWFIRTGRLDHAIELTRRLMKDGFYVNPAAFPAVPRGYGGIRFTHTLYQTDDQILALIDSMARHLPEIIDEPEIIFDLTEADALTA
ncbi:MAG: aminotransferase class I/II-fold pyridoxal phosphate-dependent enzyme [Acidimicrobiia bacterium]|nr:aminotransferase class I/II-fold pyridoxal phosphate-dependent enzyme [Acidimicrobiia bacterium]